MESRPDLVVLDNSMPKMTGVEVARSLHSELPDTRIVFLTLDPSVRDAALRSGATSVVLKDAPPSQLLDAIRRAAGRLTTPVRPLVAPARPRPVPLFTPTPPAQRRRARRTLAIAGVAAALLVFPSPCGLLRPRPTSVPARCTHG